MGRRGYPPEFRRKVPDLVEAVRPADMGGVATAGPSPDEPVRRRQHTAGDRLVVYLLGRSAQQLGVQSWLAETVRVAESQACR